MRAHTFHFWKSKSNLIKKITGISKNRVGSQGEILGEIPMSGILGQKRPWPLINNQTSYTISHHHKVPKVSWARMATFQSTSMKIYLHKYKMINSNYCKWIKNCRKNSLKQNAKTKKHSNKTYALKIAFNNCNRAYHSYNRAKKHSRRARMDSNRTKKYFKWSCRKLWSSLIFTRKRRNN